MEDTLSLHGELRVVEHVPRAFAALVVEEAPASLALSGGSTARKCYELLAGAEPVTIARLAATIATRENPPGAWYAPGTPFQSLAAGNIPAAEGPLGITGSPSVQHAARSRGTGRRCTVRSSVLRQILGMA